MAVPNKVSPAKATAKAAATKTAAGKPNLPGFESVVTTLRGPWPGVKQHGVVGLRVIEEEYVDEGKIAYNKGTSRYEDTIDKMVAAAPGKIAVETPSPAAGKAFVHAICRYLKKHGLEGKLRPAIKKSGEGAKVWILEKTND
jgi:hypothetical protein